MPSIGKSRNPPAAVGPYRIAGRIGSGGMGEVYKAYDERLERWVAVKKLLADISGEESQRERFRREARAVASINHPSIIQIFDIVESEDGDDWIVMELVEGQSLKLILADGALDTNIVVRLGRQIAEGLAAAHGRGIVHRDLKIDNVMVAPLGHVKILDFGLAKEFDPQGSDSSGLSTPGSVLGTSHVMSPEQVMGLEVDFRSDLFSLGALLFEAATGESPFKAANAILTLARVCNHRQPSTRELRPDVPQELSDLIDRLLEKDPDDRPASTDEVVDVLRSMELRPSDEALRPAAFERSGSSASSKASGRSQTETSGFYVKTLLLISLLDNDRLVERLGDTLAYELFARHDRLTRDLLVSFSGHEIHKTDGFLLLFERPVDAVEYMLLYQERLRELSDEVGFKLSARAAVHLGEVFLHENSAEDVARGAKQFEVEGRAKLITGRLARLALPGQILITREAYELARRALHKRDEEEDEDGPRLVWAAHGDYQLEGVHQSLALFEVGREGVAPLRAPRRRGVRRWWPLAVAALIMIVAALWWWQQPRPGRVVRPTVAVLGFKNLSGETEHAWLSTALAELLTSELAAGQKLRLIPGESIARMKRELDVTDLETMSPDTLRTIGRNLGTDYVIVGSYLLIAEEDVDTLVFQPALQSTWTGDTIDVWRKDGRHTELMDLVAEAGSLMRDRLGVGLATQQEAAQARATLPANQQVARLYSEGLIKLRGYDAQGARDLLLEAAVIDPDYALIHAALSEVWTRLGYDSRARASARRAQTLSGDLSREEQLRIEGRSYEAANRWEDAISTYEALWLFYVQEQDYGLRLIHAEIKARRFADAHKTLEQLHGLPAPSRDDPRIDLAAAELAKLEGDHSAVIETAQRVQKKGGEQGALFLVTDALQAEGWARRQLGQHREAVEAFRRARALAEQTGDPSEKAEVLNGLALLRQDRGDTGGAEMLYRESLAMHRQTGNQWWMAILLGNLALTLEVQGKLEEAEELMEEAADIFREIGDFEYEAWQREVLVLVLIHQGRVADGLGIVEEETQAVPRFHRRGLVARSVVESELAFYMGDLRKSISILENAIENVPEDEDPRFTASFYQALGRAYHHRGRFDDAKDMLETARSIWLEVGDRGRAAESDVEQARLLLARNRPAEAVAMLNKAIKPLEHENRRDAMAQARVTLAEALFEQGQLQEAKNVLALVRARAELTECALVRHAAVLAEARILAVDDPDRSRRRIESILEDVTESQIVYQQLLARLTLGALELEDNAARGQERLQALEAEAGEKGWDWIAERARLGPGTRDTRDRR